MQKTAMKLLLLLLCSMLTAGVYAQVENGRQAIPLSQALEEITRKYDTKFVFDTELIKRRSTQVVVGNLKNLPLEEVLKRVLYPANLLFVYVSENNYMLIQRPVQAKPGAAPVANAKAVAAEAVTTANHALRGIITDVATREALPGVTVRLLPSGKGVLTDQNGRFVFHDTDPGEHTVRASFIGYSTREMSGSTDAIMQIGLVQDTRTLDEVKVVEVGYGTKRKEAITGAVSSVSNKTITQMPTPVLSTALIGTIPGLFGKQSGGSPGKDFSRLLIRSSSFLNSPLVVIDGVPLNDASYGGMLGSQAGLNDIDPMDVESVTVLKDAASTAIYGSRGGNGVILVTTKRGKIGKPKFTFAASTTYSRPTQRPKFVDNHTQALLENEYAQNSGRGTIYSDAVLDTIRLGLNPDKYANTNWYNAVLRDFSNGQNYNLNVNGGTEGIRYNVSGGFNNQRSLLAAMGGMKRYSIASNLDTRLSKHFTVGVDLSYRYEQVEEPPTGANTVMSGVFGMSPLQPVYFSNGLPAAHYTGTVSNPAVQAGNSGYSRTFGNYLNAKLKAEYAIPFVKGLAARAMTSFDRNSYGSKDFKVPYKLYRANSLGAYTAVAGVDNRGADLKPTLLQNESRASFTTMEFGLNYDRSFGLHHLSGMALYTTNESMVTFLSAGRNNIFTPSTDELFAGNASVNSTNNGYTREFGRVGYVGRLAYSYNARYYLEGSFRSEASVNYADGHRWGFFPSVSAGWRLSEEHFLKDHASWLDELKLKASYGMAGDESGAGFSSYLNNFSVGQNTGNLNSTTGKMAYIFGGVFAPSLYTRDVIPNTNITWGVMRSVNAGVNMSVLKGLFAAELEVYRKNNSNILISVTDDVPLTFGAVTPMLNMGKTHTTGFELTLMHNNTVGKNFSYSVKSMISRTKTITDFSGEQAGLPAWNEGQYNGWSPNVSRIYKSLGLFQSQAEIDAWAVQDGRNNKTLHPGDIRFADLNGDHIIDQQDVIVKDNVAIPLLNYSLTLGAAWKQLSMDATFQGIGDYTNLVGYKIWSNYDARQLDRWTPDNPDATWPRLGAQPSNSRTSDFYSMNGNYLRLRSLRLAYNVQPLWLKRYGLEAVSFNVQGGNLFVISKIKFIDPENDSVNSYGVQKTFSAGAVVKF
ncbi:SusC/RagA family TonB-linked outer membrane protein [Chitinophaga solisilvae]|uniref:SusC/RagA family TonB-linked outer membrane protein n=1 Tax=Chitinophaga solisilvae TaxID=1233460 RepID=UPI00136E7022|nr:TonB-dependent receptor [Chitinophaga solisilvae]